MVYQLKITLRGVKPPIWRRVLVPSDITLGELHSIIQIAMGWTDSHLHLFRLGETEYAPRDPEDDRGYGFVINDEDKFRLRQVLTDETRRFEYHYDFGDGWKHNIVVERVVPRSEDHTYPMCATGRRACPPEDCGGPYGYAAFLAAIGDPEHPDHGMYLEWTGGHFDPEEFDLGDTNRALARLG
jgi:hypothetical protein